MRSFAVALVLVALCVPVHAKTPAKSGASACPAGMITCAEYCRRNPQRTTCMTGHPNSCDQKPQGAQTCVQ